MTGAESRLTRLKKITVKNKVGQKLVRHNSLYCSTFEKNGRLETGQKDFRDPGSGCQASTDSASQK